MLEELFHSFVLDTEHAGGVLFESARVPETYDLTYSTHFSIGNFEGRLSSKADCMNPMDPHNRILIIYVYIVNHCYEPLD